MNKRTRIKFCGMTRAEDIKAACDLGVDAVGVILYPKSRRGLSLSQAEKITNALSPLVSLVAVMVNPSRKEVEAAINTLPMQYIQFHGNESADFCDSFAFPYIKAIQAKNAIYILEQAMQFSKAEAILLDTPSGGAFGGKGECFDWECIPKNITKPLILAGGLNANTVANAIRTVSPYALDLCSGIESVAGIKDAKKMLSFMHNLRKGDLHV